MSGNIFSFVWVNPQLLLLGKSVEGQILKHSIVNFVLKSEEDNVSLTLGRRSRSKMVYGKSKGQRSDVVKLTPIESF